MKTVRGRPCACALCIGDDGCEIVGDDAYDMCYAKCLLFVFKSSMLNKVGLSVICDRHTAKMERYEEE